MKTNKLYIVLSIIVFLVVGCKKGSKDKEVKKEESKNSDIKTSAPLKSMKPPTKIKVTVPKDNTQNAKSLINLLTKKEYKKVEELFGPELKKVLPSPKLEAAWKAILGIAGNFKNIIEVKKVVRGKFQIFSVITKFEKSKWNLKLVFDKKNHVIGFTAAPVLKPWRVPAYANSKKFTEIEIKIGKGKWQLPGTLTLPKGTGPYPLVIFVHGSGPNDRDETIMSNKVFKDLAWGLATVGTASIRYDKRTRVYGKIMLPEKTTLMEECVDDVVIAFNQFIKDKRFNPGKIYVLGHSLGGYAMPLIAKHTPKAAGYIMMAGSSIPLAQKIVEQIKYLASLEKSIDEKSKQVIKDEERRAKIVLSDKLTLKTLPKDLPFGKGHPAYWLFMKKYDHLTMARKIKAPLLILQGERDYQVTMKGDFALWKKTLGKLKNAKFISYPALNHLFIAGHGKPNNKEYANLGNVDKKVIKDISAFTASVK